MNNTSNQNRSGNRIAKFGMAACCLIMAAPIGIVLLTGGFGAVLGNIGLFLPLALCLGMHVIMHRMMGRSCHGAGSEDTEADSPLDSVPIERPSTALQSR